MWTVLVDAKPRKILRWIPEGDAARVGAALDRLVDNPFAGDVKTLRGNEHRLRVGSYRAFLELDFFIRGVRVTRIERRTSTTY